MTAMVFELIDEFKLKYGKAPTRLIISKELWDKMLEENKEIMAYQTSEKIIRFNGLEVTIGDDPIEVMAVGVI